MSSTETLEVVCPHCSKPFASPLMGSGRHSGFKCPHCKLFVPVDRAGDSGDNLVPKPVRPPVPGTGSKRAICSESSVPGTVTGP